MATNPYDFMSGTSDPNLPPRDAGWGGIQFAKDSSTSTGNGPLPYAAPYTPYPMPAQQQQTTSPFSGATQNPATGPTYTPSTSPTYNYQVPTPVVPTGTQVTLPTVGKQNPVGYANTTDWWSDAKNQATMNSALPYQQYEQNRYQYAQDFNEAQKRYNEQFGWTQASDQFNMGLAAQQQQAAEWQAQEAAKQWAAQFGYTQTQDQRTWDLANQQLGLDKTLGMGNLANQQQMTANTGQFQTGQLANQQQANQFQNAYWQGQLGNQATEIANTGAFQTGQLANTGRGLDITQQNNLANQGLQGRQLDITDWFQRQNVGIAQEQNSIDRMYKTGQIDLGQRNAALAELTQQQQNAFQYANMQNQLKMANVAAFGRVQAPNSKWNRSWA